MRLKAPGVSTSKTYKNGKEEHCLHTNQITCDVCKAVVVGLGVVIHVIGMLAQYVLVCKA